VELRITQVGDERVSVAIGFVQLIDDSLNVLRECLSGLHPLILREAGRLGDEPARNRTAVAVLHSSGSL
jgi:hypothetical protein